MTQQEKTQINLGNIFAAKCVYAEIISKHDVYEIKITKTEAQRLIKCYGHAFTTIVYNNGDVYVVADKDA